MREELLCLDPEKGEQLFDDYMVDALSPSERKEFERHLQYCIKCHRELYYVKWVFRHLEASKEKEPAKEVFASYKIQGGAPLQITSIYDWTSLNLSHRYYETPLVETLAASQEEIGTLTFPITVEYLEGQVIGQFWKRAQYLSFRLTKCPKLQSYSLMYKTASLRKSFEVRQEEEILLGAFHEFLDADTAESILKSLRQFQLFLNPNPRNEQEHDE